jgi:hypothetical protein
VNRWVLLLILVALGLFAASPASAQGSFFSDIAWRYTPAGVFPASGATITVCTSAGSGTPCTPKISLFSDAALSVPVANPLPTCTTSPQFGCIDGLGNFSFYASTTGPYVYTVTGSGLSAYGPIPMTASLNPGVNIAFTGNDTFAKINGVVYLDGVVNTTLATCYAAIAAGGGACVVPPLYTETLGASLTMNKSGAGFIFLGPATITMGSNQVIVPAATHGVYLKGGIPFGGGLFATGKGVTFTYTGSGKAFQVGDGAGATNRAFEFSDITVDLSGASSGASGLYMTNVVYFKLSTPSVVGNNSTTGTKGIVCDGTGNFCGTGIIINPYMTGLGTGILGTGSGGSAMNAAVIIGGTVGSSVVGAIGLDIENGDSSSVYGLDLESLAVAVKLGANAAGNFIRIRQEANTTDVQALAGSQFNVVQVERANVPVVSDAGTSNQFYRTQDGKFLNVYTPVIQSPAGGNTALVDNAAVTQAAVVPGAFEVLNIFALAAGAKIQDASSGVHAGITLKSGSGGGNYTGTNTGYGNVDTTNLCTVLTIPTGWKLTVVANGVIESVTAAVAQSFALSDIGTACGGAGTTPLAGSERTYTPPAIATFDVGLSTQAVINGDGLAHAISLQAKTSAGADAWGIQNTSSAAAPSMIFTLTPSN